MKVGLGDGIIEGSVEGKDVGLTEGIIVGSTVDIRTTVRPVHVNKAQHPCHILNLRHVAVADAGTKYTISEQ